MTVGGKALRGQQCVILSCCSYDCRYSASAGLSLWQLIFMGLFMCEASGSVHTGESVCVKMCFSLDVGSLTFLLLLLLEKKKILREKCHAAAKA